MPKSIQKKFIGQEQLTDDEERIVASLHRFHTAAEKQDKTLPFTVVPVSNQFTIEWRDSDASNGSRLMAASGLLNLAS